jgi:hypothetical protein
MEDRIFIIDIDCKNTLAKNLYNSIFKVDKKLL